MGKARVDLPTSMMALSLDASHTFWAVLVSAIVRKIQLRFVVLRVGFCVMEDSKFVESQVGWWSEVTGFCTEDDEFRFNKARKVRRQRAFKCQVCQRRGRGSGSFKLVGVAWLRVGSVTLIGCRLC